MLGQRLTKHFSISLSSEAMFKFLTTYNIFEKLKWISLLLAVFCLVWPIKVSSISITLFLVLALISLKKKFVWNKTDLPLLILCTLYFLLHLGYAVFSSYDSSAFEIEKKIGFFAYPFILLNNEFLISKEKARLFISVYISSIIIACLTCLGLATHSFLYTQSTNNFYYHQLCNPISQHAVYFSSQILFGLVCMFQTDSIFKNNVLRSAIALLFTICLFLLSSKIMLLCLLLIVMWYGFKIMISKSLSHKWLLILVPLCFAAIWLLTGKEITKRLSDIEIDRTKQTTQTTFTPATYFDGLSLRALQLKFALEIISENKAWLVGVGPFKAQTLLNRKYKEANMYLGEDGKSGYLNYNFHNQFAETFVRFGWIGLLIIMSVFYILIRKAWILNNPILLAGCVIYLVFCFSESVLETHRGMSMMLFFNLCLLKTDGLKPIPKQEYA